MERMNFDQRLKLLEIENRQWKERWKEQEHVLELTHDSIARLQAVAINNEVRLSKLGDRLAQVAEKGVFALAATVDRYIVAHFEATKRNQALLSDVARLQSGIAQAETEPPKPDGAAEQEVRPLELPNIDIEHLDLSVRAYNALRNWEQSEYKGSRVEIGPRPITVRDLANVTRKQLLALNNCGRKTVREIEDALGALGVTLSETSLTTNA